MRWARFMSWLPVGLSAWLSSSCAPSGFQDASQVTSVRILASTADKPYAKPGDSVNLTVLAVDGRTSPAVPMTIYWLPFVCENPPNDAYFGCFRQIASGGSAAAPDGGGGAAADAGGGFAAGDGGAIGPGVDLTQLPTGPTYTFTMPLDAVTSHSSTPGIAVPYGLAILFNIACAGHIEIVPLDPSNANPQQVPIGCFDANHNQLGPDDWVFGFTRVYAYDDITNANPTVSSVDLGANMPVAVTGTPPAYTTSKLDTQICTGNCTKVKIGPSVPAMSWEVQSQLGPGTQTHEEIWADFFATFGKLDNGARLLYDSTRGQLGAGSVTDNAFTPPTTATPGDGTLWIVVHDNRGGASWITVPVHVM
jgi:hypothetical protein